MITFLGTVILIIMVIWMANISSRLGRLENNLQQGKQPNSTPIAPSSPQIVSQPNLRNSPALTEDSILNGNWLAIIGSLAVVIGVGFFIKYAIDQGWINEWARVVLGLAGGLLLCVLGNLWKKKYSLYAGALTGGGIALMYFSIFASYQFYQLLPQTVAIVLMITISGLDIWLAYDRKSLGLAVLGILGAYLSPIILHSNTDQHTALFIYLSLINISAIVVLFKNYWSELLILSFIGTLIDYVVWATSYSSNSTSAAATIFVTCSFLILLVGGAAALRKNSPGNSEAKTLPQEAGTVFGILAVLLGFFYTIAIWLALYQNFHYYLAILGLLGSVGAFLAYTIVDRLEIPRINYPLAFVGTALLALACIWQFSGNVTTFMVIAFGLLLVVCGTFLKRAELRVWGLLTLVATMLATLFTSYDQNTYVFILNAKFGLVLTETAALWVTGWLYNYVQAAVDATEHEKSVDLEKNAGAIAEVLGSLVLWFGFSWELIQYFQSQANYSASNLVLSMWWIGYATALIIFAGVAKSSTFKKIALVIYALAIFKVFLFDSLSLETGYRIVSFIVLGVILLTVSYFYQHNREKIKEYLAEKK